MSRRFSLVDVFGVAPFSGNPLAVVADAEGLTPDEMQAITRWLNLSETTFLLPPTDAEADYRVRIFCLTRELPFAGHPTLGTCHAWLSGGGRPRDPGRIVQQCDAGLIPIRAEAGRLAFAAPPLLRGGPVDDATLDETAAVLRIGRDAIVEARWIDNGPGWLGVMLASAEAVLAVNPVGHTPRHVDIGLVGAHPPGADCAFELRALFNDAQGTMIEDPCDGQPQRLGGAVAVRERARGRRLRRRPGHAPRPNGPGSGRAGRGRPGLGRRPDHRRCSLDRRCRMGPDRRRAPRVGAGRRNLFRRPAYNDGINEETP